MWNFLSLSLCVDKRRGKGSPWENHVQSRNGVEYSCHSELKLTFLHFLSFFSVSIIFKTFASVPSWQMKAYTEWVKVESELQGKTAWDYNFSNSQPTYWAIYVLKFQVGELSTQQAPCAIEKNCVWVLSENLMNWKCAKNSKLQRKRFGSSTNVESHTLSNGANMWKTESH